MPDPEQISPLASPRLSVGLVAREPIKVDPVEVANGFHRWIQEDRLAGELPVDVADYTHVRGGPGVVLICHGAQISFGDVLGKIGLWYRRSRDLPGVSDRVQEVFRRALQAAGLLEEAFPGRLEFRPEELFFRVDDRFAAPNLPATLASAAPGLEALTRRLSGSGTPRIERLGGGGELFTLRIQGIAAGAVSEVLKRV